MTIHFDLNTRRFMNNRTRFTILPALLALATGMAACDREVTGSMEPGAELQTAALDSTFSSNTNRTFAQVERLANPLVMEVFVEKREHDAYDAFNPQRDPGHFTDDVVHFVTKVAQRDEAYARVIASVLLGTASWPGDMIKVHTNRAAGVTGANVGTAANVGWLSQVLDPTNGYGGRKVSGDDTVDKGTAVVFGNAAGNNNNVSPGLVGDNVPSNDKAALTTFPYFPTPH